MNPRSHQRRDERKIATEQGSGRHGGRVLVENAIRSNIDTLLSRCGIRRCGAVFINLTSSLGKILTPASDLPMLRKVTLLVDQPSANEFSFPNPIGRGAIVRKCAYQTAPIRPLAKREESWR
jgi:hypothetical protein